MFFFLQQKNVFFKPNPDGTVVEMPELPRRFVEKWPRFSQHLSENRVKSVFQVDLQQVDPWFLCIFLAAVGNTRLWFAELHFWCQRRPARAPDATAGNAFGESIVQQPSSELLRKVLAWRLLGLTTFLLEVDEIGRCHKFWQLKAVLPKRRGQENFAERAAAWVQQHRIYTVALFFFVSSFSLAACVLIFAEWTTLLGKKKNASSTKATVGAHV